MTQNWKNSFIDPLVFKLDKGLITGPEDWADAIVKSYIKTVQDLKPMGTVPVLPAPGLNGASFNIGEIAITKASAQSREKAMYTVIHAYYFAKELSMNKSSIEGLIKTVKLLITKIKTTQQQVKTTIEQIKIIQEELKQLPPLLVEIIDAIKEVIEEQVINVGNIELSFDTIKKQISPEMFNNVFSRELGVIETIKNFDPTNIAGIKEILLFISDYGSRTVNTLADLENKPIKDYINGKLIGIGREFIALGNGIINPGQLLDYVKQAAPTRPKMQAVYEKVKRFTAIQTLLKPQLKKLEKKKKKLIKKVKIYLQKKIVDIKEKIKTRIAEHKARKKEGKASLLFKKAKQKIQKFREEKQPKLKLLQKKIVQYKEIAKAANKINGTITVLITSLEDEFKSIKEEIEAQIELTKKLIPNFLENLDASAEIAKANKYTTLLGIAEFAEPLVLIITQTKCDFQTFKSFFEKKAARIMRYVRQIQSIEREIENIQKAIKKIQELNNPKKEEGLESVIEPIEAVGTKKSLKDIIKDIVARIKPKVKALIKWIKKKIKKIGDYLKRYIDKTKVELEYFAYSLIPLSSGTEDTKNKKLDTEAKKKKIVEKKAALDLFLKKTKAIIDMAKGSKTLLENVASKKYKFADYEQAKDTFLRGYYNYKKIGQTRSYKLQLDEQKRNFNSEFDAIKMIEALIYGIIASIEDMQETDFKAEIKRIIQSAKENAPGVQTIKAISDLIENPPKTMEEIIDTTEKLAGGLLQDKAALSTILNLERKYLRKSRQIVKTLCNTKLITNEKVKSQLNKIKITLDKNGSFILYAFGKLKEVLIKFKNFLAKKIKKVVDSIKKKIKAQQDKKEKEFQEDAAKRVERKANIDASIQGIVFGLATKVFWTGANWVNTKTGTNHVVLTIGPFKKIEAKPIDGATGMITEMGKSFEKQLTAMTGLVIPPLNTLLPPQPFTSLGSSL